MTAIEILRAASRSVPNEDYVQFMAAVDAVAELIDADVMFDAVSSRRDKYPCPGMDEHVRAAKKRRAAAIVNAGGA